MTSPIGPHFREAREGDVDTLLALREACAAADGHDPLSIAETLPTKDDLRQLTTGDPQRCAILTFHDAVIAYGRIGEWLEADGMQVWLHRGWVHPAWRGKGLGGTLLRELERRIGELAAAGGHRPWEYAANAAENEPAAARLLLDNGYHVGYTVLEMALDWDAFDAALGEALPPGFTTRPVTIDDAPGIVASVAEAYRHEYTGDRFREVMDEAAFLADLTGPRFDLSLAQVAWAGEEVAGQVLPLVEQGRAIIDEVSVRPAYRRRGLAAVLLVRALRALHGRGVEHVRLDTVQEFPTRAIALYERVGFRIVNRFPRYRKPATGR